MSTNIPLEVLRERQALPLTDKIGLAKERIVEFGESFDWLVYLSLSGGIDSGVLAHIIEQVHPGLPFVYCNTGLEYPEINRHVARLKKLYNIHIIKPSMSFSAVLREYGWPIASKMTARGIKELRIPEEDRSNTYRLYDEGITSEGQNASSYKVAQQWRFLVDAPFGVSNGCCEEMKHKPFYQYERETKRVGFVGIMADESQMREKTYLDSGCNAFDHKRPRSWPLAFWTRQDVLEYTQCYNVPYASVYGDIVRTDGGGLETTGVRRTGCIFCLFGLHMEKSPNRIQQLALTHPKLWDYCMHKLGMSEVFKYVRDNAKPRLANKFYAEPCAVSRELTLPGLE